MTIVELTVSMLVLFIAVAATMGTITSFSSLESSNEASIRAYVSARRTLENLQALPFTEVFARFNEVDGDDPGGSGTAEGAGFDVTGLDVRSDDGDGMVGRVIFPVDEVSPGVLREDFVAADFGLPRDLDLDGLVDGADRSGDYRVLPVRVRIEWTGASGDRAVQLQTVLVPR